MAINRLKIVVSLLHEIADGNIPTAEDYGITEQDLNNILYEIQKENFVDNLKVNFDKNKQPIVTTDHARITIKGMEYLNNNSALMKTYRGLKEVREWLPF